MKTRPKSVSFICWLLIVVGALALIRMPFTMRNPAVNDLLARSPLPLPLIYALSFVNLAVTITCGIAMLKAHNWARYSYAIWGAFNVVVGLATFPVRLILIPGILVYALFVFLLFRPQASRYFTERAEPSDGANAALGAPRSSS